MNITCHKKHRDVEASEFNNDGFMDLAYITGWIREHYDPETFNCTRVADVLSKMYTNLVPVEVGTIVYDGAVQQKGHVVLQIKGTQFLIDPVGDCLSYSNPVRLKHDIVPWIYSYYREGGCYLSQNHVPAGNLGSREAFEDIESELDVLRLSAGPFYKGLRAITL